MSQLLDVAALTAAKQQGFTQPLANNSQSMRNFGVLSGTERRFHGGEAPSGRIGRIHVIEQRRIGDVLLLVEYAAS